MFDHPHRGSFFLCLEWNLSLCPLSLVLWLATKEKNLYFLPPSGVSADWWVYFKASLLQLSQPPLVWKMLPFLHHLCAPLLENLLQLVSPCLSCIGGPSTGPHIPGVSQPCWAEGKDPLPWPAGDTMSKAAYAAQDADGFLCCEGMLLAQVQNHSLFHKFVFQLCLARMLSSSCFAPKFPWRSVRSDGMWPWEVTLSLGLCTFVQPACPVLPAAEAVCMPINSSSIWHLQLAWEPCDGSWTWLQWPAREHGPSWNPYQCSVCSHSVDMNTRAWFCTELSLLQVASCLSLHKNVS